LADENIPLLVIKELRKAGFNIISAAENYRGSSDKEILDLSSKSRCENHKIIIEEEDGRGILIK
jgi:hypothetical protein